MEGQKGFQREKIPLSKVLAVTTICAFFVIGLIFFFHKIYQIKLSLASTTSVNTGFCVNLYSSLENGVQCTSDSGMKTDINNINSLVKFTLPANPGNATISSISLVGKLWFSDPPGAQVDMHQVTRSGVTDAATWLTYDGTNPWTTSGGDFNPAIISSAVFTGNAGDSITFPLYGDGATNPVSLNWGDSVVLLFRTLSGGSAGLLENPDQPIVLQINYSSPPVISAVSSTPASSGATITWSTDQLTSSQVVYGSDTSYASSTSISDSAADTGVTNHSVALTNLVSCTKYNYKVVSTFFGGATATSSANSFTTSGCAGGASVISQTQSTVTSGAGGTVSHTEGNNTMSVTMPVGFSTTTAVDVQIKALSGTTVIASIGKPSANLSSVGSSVFDVKALVGSGTTLDSFSSALTITMGYADADIGSLDETSFLIYHYHNNAWEALSGCSVNASANTVTCSTTNFSEFSIFGSAVVSTPVGSGGGILYPGWSSLRGAASGVSIATSTVISTSTTSSISFSAVSSTITTPLPPEENSIISTSTVFVEAPPVEVLPANPVPARPNFTYVFKRTLQLGSRGEDVKQLQKFLNNHGYTVAKKGNGSPGHEITYFGVGTRAALRRFQADHAKEILLPQRIKRPTGIFANGSRRYINKIIAEEAR